MRLKMTAACACATINFLLASCSSTTPAGNDAALETGCSSDPARPARINHMAFFKMKSQADAKEIVADCDRLLRPIPGIRSYFAGPRLESGRANVDTSFDVGFYVGFDTLEAYDRYVKDPRHQEALSKWKPRWESARIVDVIDETP